MLTWVLSQNGLDRILVLFPGISRTVSAPGMIRRVPEPRIQHLLRLVSSGLQVVTWVYNQTDSDRDLVRKSRVSRGVFFEEVVI